MKRARTVLLGLALAGCGGDRRPALVLLREDGAVVRRFERVAFASLPDERARGLSGRPAPLAFDEALVLEFPVVDEACVTNAAVGFPITALFVDERHAVLAAEPLGAADARAPCHAGTLRVIEIDEGGAAGATRAEIE